MEDDCDWKKTFYTSKEVKSDNPGASPFEINYRAIIAMRETGKLLWFYEFTTINECKGIQ